MKSVKVKAYKKLSPTGKIQDVDAHMRKLEKIKTLSGMIRANLESGDNSVKAAANWAKLHKERGNLEKELGLK